MWEYNDSLQAPTKDKDQGQINLLGGPGQTELWAPYEQTHSSPAFFVCFIQMWLNVNICKKTHHVSIKANL